MECSQNTGGVVLGSVHSASSRREAAHVGIRRVHANRAPGRCAAVRIDVEASLICGLVMEAPLRRMDGELVGILVVDTFDDIYTTVSVRVATAEAVTLTNFTTIGPIWRRAPERRPDGTTVREMLRIDDPECTEIIELLRCKADLKQQD